MKIKVTLRKNETGEEVVYEDNDCTYENEENIDYQWTEGNYSCDCNRHLFFERAKGNDPDLDEGECGDDKYTLVSIINVETGKIIKL